MRFSLISSGAIYVGFLFALPFAIANTVAVTGIAPLYSWLAGLGPYVIFAVITLGFFGGIAVLMPLFWKSADGARTFYILNALIGLGLMAFFVVIGYALGEEIYRCDILKIPNCD